MDAVTIQLTVYFADPFWVGVFKRSSDGKTEAARVVFGAQPKDGEVYRLILERFYELRFSPAIADERRTPACANPKRRQREATRRVEGSGAGTKAQQALKQLQEQDKRERKTDSKQEREAEAERKFRRRQEKQRQRHKGR